MKRQYALPLFFALAAYGGFAIAQSQPPLNKDEVTNTVVGKKVEHMRLSDKRIFVWDVRESGTLYLQNSSLKGKWALNESGEFCVKWDVAQVPDQCYFFYRGDGLSAGPTSTPGKMTSTIKSVK